MRDPNLKEAEDIYFWVDKQIASSTKRIHLEACEVLINHFEKCKFKKDIPTQKEMRDYLIILRKCLKRKNTVLRKREFVERKNNGNGNYGKV